MSKYTENFYTYMKGNTRDSAEVVVPLVLDLIGPQSVVDIGCGVGVWLSVFKENGIRDFLGFDGDYVNRDMLCIPKENFRPQNLRDKVSLDRQFDLVMSLEVAEHLPETHAKQFVETLTSLGPVVLFSAAIPYQGGVEHINEQWPGYWAELFQERGYRAIDCFRSRLWNNPKVNWYYSQNLILYASEAYLEVHPQLKDFATQPENLVALIHPTHYLSIMDPRYMSPLKILRWLGHFLMNLPVFLSSLIQRKFKR